MSAPALSVPETADDVVATPEAPRLGMTDGDREHWHAVEAWKRRATPGGPGLWRRANAWVDAGLRMLPSVPRLPGVDDVLAPALDGLDGLGAGWGRATVGADAVVTAFRRAGHDVVALADVRALDVDQVHAVRGALHRGYTVASAVQGGVSGLLAGLGPMLQAGALGGLATLVAGLGADSVLTAAVCARAVAHVGLYYGYDAADPGEAARAVEVLAMTLGDHAAYGRFWTANHSGTRVRTSRAFGHCELAQALPAVGIGVGAVLSVRLVARVLDTAEHLYRERFLREKYALGAPSAASTGASAAAAPSS